MRRTMWSWGSAERLVGQFEHGAAAPSFGQIRGDRGQHAADPVRAEVSISDQEGPCVQPVISRRQILTGARYLAATPLIGTAMAQTPFQVKAVSKLKGSAKSVVIPTHEFAGPNGAPWIEERLDFPASWDLHVMDMAGHNHAGAHAAADRRAVQQADRHQIAAGTGGGQEDGRHQLRRPDPHHAGLRGDALADVGAEQGGHQGRECSVHRLLRYASRDDAGGGGPEARRSRLPGSTPG